MKTWLITGCSTGLGRSLAQTVLASGANVVVTARDTNTVQDIVDAYPERAVSAALDVTDKVAIKAAIELAEWRFGGVDVLVNNAGYGYRAAVEEADGGDVASLFDTNFFGAVSMIQAVLPHMRRQRSGAIVNVSSIAARLAMPGSGFYSATKFALEGMSDALRREVSPLGIKVLIVEPGAFRTDFAGRSLQASSVAIGDYDQTSGPRRKANDRSHGMQPGDPDKAARVMMEALARETPPVRLLLGSDALRIVGQEIERQREEIKTWADVTISTDFKKSV